MSKFSRMVRITSLGLALLSSAAIAQHESRWYKVELLVFTHEGAAGSEQFEPTPELGYPDNYRFLLHPSQIRSLVAQHEGESHLDAFGRLTLSPEQQEPDTPDIPQQGVNTDEAAVAGENASSQSAAPDEPQLEEAARPTAFIALPASAREFRGKAAYMENTGEYRILFHEAWAQPVMGANNAVPLVLDRSGDTGNWPELQGSIKLHVARYLHLETRLWLNTHGNYLPGDWKMPSAPLGPPSIIRIEGSEEALEGAPSTSTVTPDFAESEVAVFETSDLQEEASAAPVSPWRHAVLLEQKRRMRSLEVHYLDHPLLSVAIKLEPLNEEQLQAMAAAETPLLPEPTAAR